MNTGGLIVATPHIEDDGILHITEPHITMIWFGEAANLPPALVSEVREAVGTVSVDYGPFDVKISGVALIGPDKARVFLVESEQLAAVRHDLFAYEAIQQAYLMAERQFPFYVPHLTIGYDGELPTEWPDSIAIDALGLWLAGKHEKHQLAGDDVPVEDGELTAAAIGGQDMPPPVASLHDLDLAIAHAHTAPSARWYVAKRATALGASDKIPAQWGKELINA